MGVSNYSLASMLTYARTGKEKSRFLIIKAGFTILEIAIVLVIIGLFSGGVLYGQDLIRAAEVRSQISQITKYDVAVGTFRNKFNNALPGDIRASDAAAAGFTAIQNRVGTQGQGDGNGILEGVFSGGVRTYLLHGETVWFWADLSTNTGLIEGNFNSASATPTVVDSGFNENASPYISQILPAAKLGNNNYISVYSISGRNYYVLQRHGTGIDGNGASHSAITGLSVRQAYAVDAKIDDGLPQTGKVTARYESWDTNNSRLIWASGGGVEGATTTTATPASAITCYDNGNVAGGTQNYSITTNGGSGLNCALSVMMQ